MKTLLKHFLLITCCSIANAQEKNRGLTGPWLGQKAPGTTPEVFAPGIISTAAHEFSSCLSPDSNEFYFTRMSPEEHQNYVMCTKLQDGAWTEPAIAPFAGSFTFKPFITPDIRRIYFQTGKVADGQLFMYTMFVERTDKGWSEPVELKLGMDAGQPFVTNDGKYLFFTSGDPKIGSDIYWISAKIINILRPKE